jgi:predicted RNA-binding Zn-ribbon protein involved in translation (DUF1610 family)
MNAFQDKVVAEIERKCKTGPGEGQCPACGKAEWLPGATGYIVPEDTPAGHSFASGIRAVTVVCGHCGFVRQHQAGILSS